MTELIWDGKYKDGKKQGPVRIALPFQTIETVNESTQDRRRNLELFASGRDTEWRNRLIWGDKKYVWTLTYSGFMKLLCSSGNCWILPALYTFISTGTWVTTRRPS
jgi:hypothetical protein